MSEQTMWIVGILLTVINTLGGGLCFLLWSAVAELKKSIKESEEKREALRVELTTMIRTLADKLDAERKERIDKHDATTQLVFTEIHKVESKAADLAETAAGFGSVYLPRREYEAREHNKGGQ